MDMLNPDSSMVEHIPDDTLFDSHPVNNASTKRPRDEDSDADVRSAQPVGKPATKKSSGRQNKRAKADQEQYEEQKRAQSLESERTYNVRLAEARRPPIVNVENCFLMVPESLGALKDLTSQDFKFFSLDSKSVAKIIAELSKDDSAVVTTNGNA